jgi:hypothetical protein
VVDSGRELSVTYDLELKATVSEMTWISQASQRQRRGRAGRTAPGKCYCLYSQEDFDTKMTENAIPPIRKMNCDTFYLGLVANGMDPNTVTLIDNPEDRMEAARLDLIRFGAIEMDETIVPPAPKVTKMGKAMNQLPVKLALAKSILAGVTVECCEPLCVIAAMMETSERYPLFIGDRDAQAVGKEQFKAPTGDHETILNLYEKWAKSNKDKYWCRSHGVNEKAMWQADEMLTRIRKSLQNSNYPFSTCLPSDPERSDKIMFALCAGATDKVAIAMDPTSPSKGFRLLSGYESNPVVSLLHPSCVIGKNDQNVQVVIYHGRTVGANGNHLISNVSSVNVGHVLQAHQNIMDPAEFARFRTDFLNLQHQVHTIVFTLPGSSDPYPLKSHEQAVFSGNVGNVKRDYPLVVIKQHFKNVGGGVAGLMGSGPKAAHAFVDLSCPAGVKDEIEGKLREAFESARDHTVAIRNVANYAAHVDKKGALTVTSQQFRDSLRDKYKSAKLQLNGSTDGSTLEVKAMGAIIDMVVADVNAYVGGATATGGGSGGNVAPPDEQLRIGWLFNPAITRDQILAQFGKGIEGTMFLYAHNLVHNTSMNVYGGYIRDFLIRGDSHTAMDLDIAIPPNSSPDTQAASVRNIHLLTTSNHTHTSSFIFFLFILCDSNLCNILRRATCSWRTG